MRECGLCVHAAFFSGGVYCMEFNEVIADERVAEECGVFDFETSPLTLVSKSQ